jgi:hypothetical protein
MKNMVFRFVGNLSIVIHNKNTPDDTEVQEYLSLLRAQDMERLRSLVFTDGGGPSPAQRKRFNDILRGRELPTAVVSNDRMVRGITIAMSWFNRKIKAFPPDAVQDAFTYLNIPKHEFESVWRLVKQLRTELTGEPAARTK